MSYIIQEYKGEWVTLEQVSDLEWETQLRLAKQTRKTGIPHRIIDENGREVVSFVKGDKIEPEVTATEEIMIKQSRAGEEWIANHPKQGVVQNDNSCQIVIRRDISVLTGRRGIK